MTMDISPKRVRRNAGFSMFVGIILLLFVGSAVIQGVAFFHNEDGGISWFRCGWPVLALFQIVTGYHKYNNPQRYANTEE